jgi:hypothetical protein
VLPFLFLGSPAGLEVVHPMALVILGGLVTSTLLSLFVVPALYLRFGAGARSARTAADELMHRWAGAEPAVGEDRLEAAQPGLRGGTTPSGGADSVQTRGEE